MRTIDRIVILLMFIIPSIIIVGTILYDVTWLVWFFYYASHDVQFPKMFVPVSCGSVCIHLFYVVFIPTFIQHYKLALKELNGDVNTIKDFVARCAAACIYNIVFLICLFCNPIFIILEKIFGWIFISISMLILIGLIVCTKQTIRFLFNLFFTVK